MTRRVLVGSLSTLLLVLTTVQPAQAQALRDIGVRGFAMFGDIQWTAEDSFDAVLDRHSGPIFGGGGQVLLPWGVFVEIGAWRFNGEGERVFIGPNDEVFKLGIPVDVAITPFEVTAGFRFAKFLRKVFPYGGVGYSSYRYQETSEFSLPGEDVDEHFTGVHVIGGVEYQIRRWLAVQGEIGWSSIADAIGQSAVSSHFAEDNLGGTSLRLKISVGR